MIKLLQFSGRPSLAKIFIRKTSDETQDALTPKKLKMINYCFYGASVVIGGACVLGYYLEKTIKATDLVVHPQKLDWFHNQSFWHGYDVKAVRRGYQVYKQVCAACHSIMLYEYRHFVNTIMTEEEAKAEAAMEMIEDGPNDNGEMFMRPRRLTDQLPKAYKSEVHAKLANNMAVPPDMMLITLARHGGEDYIFHLLTGYQEAPQGVQLGQGQAYNPYFPNGSVLSMAQQLFDDMLTYDDGTPATQSQMAKDVTNFLKYLAEPDLELRKKMALKVMTMGIPLSFLLLYYKRFIASTWKSQKVLFRRIKGRDESVAPKR